MRQPQEQGRSLPLYKEIKLQSKTKEKLVKAMIWNAKEMFSDIYVQVFYFPWQQNAFCNENETN
jgi:hypothetical protein